MVCGPQALFSAPIVAPAKEAAEESEEEEPGTSMVSEPLEKAWEKSGPHEAIREMLFL